MRKYLTVHSLLWLALALALLGSLRHMAATYAAVDGEPWAGWMQAIPIDVGLFALAYGVRTRKAQRRPTRFIWLGIGLFTGISIYGNLSYGMQAAGQVPGWIVATRPYVLAASLPILVLYLSELVSDNRQYEAAQEAKEAKKEARKGVTDGQTTPSLDDANAAREAKISGRRAQVLTLLQQDRTQAEIANQLEVSPRTIRRDIEALNGQVRNVVE